jgi:hypothetical protein
MDYIEELIWDRVKHCDGRGCGREELIGDQKKRQKSK